MTREEAYESVAKLAADHALIHQAYGGVIVIVHPDTQRAEGIEAHCLHVAGQGEHPETLKQREQTAGLHANTKQQLDIFNALLDAEQQEGAE